MSYQSLLSCLNDKKQGVSGCGLVLELANGCCWDILIRVFKARRRFYYFVLVYLVIFGFLVICLNLFPSQFPAIIRSSAARKVSIAKTVPKAAWSRGLSATSVAAPNWNALVSLTFSKPPLGHSCLISISTRINTRCIRYIDMNILRLLLTSYTL